jgi:parallel beta-helix repeat protein
MFRATLELLFGLRPAIAPSRTPAARAARPRLEALEDRLVPSALFVGTRKGEFATIGAALARATPGSTVLVDPGVYQEQVKIATNNVKLVADDADDLTKIMAPAGMTGSIVDVAATNVVLAGFTVDGGGNTAGSIDSAVRVEDGASATIFDNHITGLFNGTNNQTGFGIRVGTNSTTAFTSADIVANVIDAYQKGGIIVTGSGSSAFVEDNVVRGAGPAGLVAQNGIQVSTKASAVVRDNCVRDNIYTGNDFLAAGILVFNDSAQVEVTGNSATNNESGVVLDTVSGAVVIRNELESNTLDGIDLFSSTDVTIRHNKLNGNGLDGVFMQDSKFINISHNQARNNGANGFELLNSDSDVLRDNEVSHNAGDGVLLEGSSFNVVRFDKGQQNGGPAVVQDSASNNNDISSDEHSSDNGEHHGK